MKTYRDSLLAKLHILLKEQGVDEETKRAMYAGYGVDSTADLTAPQLRHLVGSLAGEAVPEVAPRQVSNETRRLRSQCLALMTKSPDPANIKLRGLGLPNDWAVLNAFVEHHAGATLNRLTDEELERFARKLRAMRSSGWFYNAPRQTTASPAAVVVLAPTDCGTVN
ncbi:hypothetical protein [uncultured Rikenella sp.]|uniref:hypothetical protein n=1 Tax=uncultured Rikenella sp. TaxID=368003 RepID=UPI0025CCABE9|nr:hypothetical protein [uncultured Rikenella sp.]